MIKYKMMLFLAIFSTLFSTINVSASTYNPTTNLFEGTYSNNLIDMATSQIDNFFNKKFVIFQVDSSYYLVTGDEYVVDGNIIRFTNSTVFSAFRSSSTGSYTYLYSTHTESSTSINANYIVISNIDSPKSVSSKRFEDYRSDTYSVILLMFILGIVFAIFVKGGF